MSTAAPGYGIELPCTPNPFAGPLAGHRGSLLAQHKGEHGTGDGE